MNKEGHLGIIKDTQQPIKKVEKIELNANLLKSTQKLAGKQQKETHGKNVSYTPLAASNRLNSQQSVHNSFN